MKKPCFLWILVKEVKHNKGEKMKKNEKGFDKLLNAAEVKPSEYPDKEQREMMRGIARMTKIKYDELIKQGFNKSQALELCKNLLSMDYKS